LVGLLRSQGENELNNWSSAVFFGFGLYWTANMLEFWGEGEVAPRKLVGLMAVLWTLFAWTQGLFA